MYDQNTPKCRYWAVRPLHEFEIALQSIFELPPSGSPGSHPRAIWMSGSADIRRKLCQILEVHTLRINTETGNMCQDTGDGRVCNFKDMPSLYLVGALHQEQ